MAGCALGEHGGEDGCESVVVIVHFGSGLAVVGMQDASDLLFEGAVERGRCSQEQGAEDRAVEAFADVLAGGLLLTGIRVSRGTGLASVRFGGRS